MLGLTWRKTFIVGMALLMARDSLPFFPAPQLMTGLHVLPYASSPDAPSTALWSGKVTHAVWQDGDFAPALVRRRTEAAPPLTASLTTLYDTQAERAVPVHGSWAAMAIALLAGAVAAKKSKKRANL